MARITVEDCLVNENNRFALVQLAAKRTKQLLSGARTHSTESKGNKVVVTALREIAAGQVRFMTEEDLELIKAKELEKLEQMQSQMSSTSADDLFMLPSELNGGSADDEDEEDDDSDDGELPVKKSASKSTEAKSSSASAVKYTAPIVEEEAETDFPAEPGIEDIDEEDAITNEVVTDDIVDDENEADEAEEEDDKLAKE